MTLLDKVPGELALYIGGLFTLRRRQQLQEANITHVLTVLRLPLDRDLFKPFKHLLVEVDDLEDENLLQHFTTTNGFIQEGLDGGGGVLVHCAMGKSRSATCVVAYLMSRYSLSPADALEQLRLARPLAEPNEGFMQQLELYHQMQCAVNVEKSPIYQRWLYQREVQLSSACGQAPDAARIRFEDEHISDHDAGDVGDVELRCRKCRTKLATSAFTIPHRPPPHNAPFPGSLTCAHHFLDPLAWMRPELEQGRLDGRLDCPRCRAAVGKYAWQGLRCSCGAWVVPAITLAKGKVDEVRIRKAAEGGTAASAERAFGIRRGPGVGLPATKEGGRGLL